MNVAEENLDDADVGPVLQKVSRKAVPERMRGHALFDLGALPCRAACALESGDADMIARFLPWKQPQGRTRALPISA